MNDNQFSLTSSPFLFLQVLGLQLQFSQDTLFFLQVHTLDAHAVLQLHLISPFEDLFKPTLLSLTIFLLLCCKQNSDW